MRIAELVWPENSMPPVGYGPIQYVASVVANGLCAEGHSVTSFTTTDSKVDGEIVSIYSTGTRNDKTIPDLLYYHSVTLAEFVKRKDEFDIVHSHIGHSIIPFLDLIDKPIVITLHGTYQNVHPQEIYKKYAQKAFFVAVSESQKRTLPGVNYAGTVYHGIDEAVYSHNEEPEDYMIFVGRTSPTKGLDTAINLAIRLKKKLKIAAHIDQTEAGINFFQEKIKPYLNEPNIEFLGEVEHDEVKLLLSKAKLLISPIRGDEAFGLCYIEALASGTPVITFDRGAAPEVFSNGVEGFLVDDGDIDLFAAKIEEVYSMSDIAYKQMRLASRKRVENNFTTKKMVEGYSEIFTKLIK